MTSGGVGQTGIATLGKQCKQGAVYRSAARPAVAGRTAADEGENSTQKVEEGGR